MGTSHSLFITHLRHASHTYNKWPLGQDIVDPRSTQITLPPTTEISTTHVTLTFDLLTWKWYLTHHPLMGCICAIHDIIHEIGNEPWMDRQTNRRKEGVKSIYPSTISLVSEWVINLNSLFGDSGHWGPYSPYKPCNYSLYIGIIIFPHINNTQSAGYN